MGNSTAVIVNPYWDSLGGGERYTAAFIRLLLDQGWQVWVKWPQDISDSISLRFGLDLSGARFGPTVPLHPDLVFWLSDGSVPRPQAKINLLHFQFPFRQTHGRSLPNLLKTRFFKVVCNSGFTKSFIDREYLVSSRVVYPPVDTKQFPLSNKKRNQILYVGRFSQLTQAKNQKLLISVFARFYRQHPDWTLCLAGGTGVGFDDRQLADYQSLAAGLPVKLVLNPDLKHLKNLYRDSKIFWAATGYGFDPHLHPTKVEHFGITVVEAMSAGCIPIVTRLGGYRETVVENTSGLFWDQPQDLLDLTNSLARDVPRQNQLSRQASLRAFEFDTSVFNRQYLSLIGL